jgi:hypothetical protein
MEDFHFPQRAVLESVIPPKEASRG